MCLRELLAATRTPPDPIVTTLCDPGRTAMVQEDRREPLAMARKGHSTPRRKPSSPKKAVTLASENKKVKAVDLVSTSAKLTMFHWLWLDHPYSRANDRFSAAGYWKSYGRVLL